MYINLLGARIDALGIDEMEEKVAELVRSGRPHQIITLNPEILYRAQKEVELLDLINGASLVTADGAGIVWASRFTGRQVPERVTGIDLMLRLVARSAKEGWRIFLLGSAPGVAEEAGRLLKQQHPELIVVGVYHGYFKAGEEHQVVEMIKKAHPHLLFVGMGAPKQEEFISRNLKFLNAPVAMGVGGSFDVIAKRVRRAPNWIQRMHLEWLFRLCCQPSRWRRMMVLPHFAWRVIYSYEIKKLRFLT